MVAAGAGEPKGGGAGMFFGGIPDGSVRPVPTEVSAWKWISFSELVADQSARPQAYTVWFRHYLPAHGKQITGWLRR